MRDRIYLSIAYLFLQLLWFHERNEKDSEIQKKTLNIICIDNEINVTRLQIKLCFMDLQVKRCRNKFLFLQEFVGLYIFY
jgi:hypothetical protein